MGYPQPLEPDPFQAFEPSTLPSWMIDFHPPPAHFSRAHVRLWQHSASTNPDAPELAQTQLPRQRRRTIRTAPLKIKKNLISIFLWFVSPINSHLSTTQFSAGCYDTN
jgi:hypothetical protein